MKDAQAGPGHRCAILLPSLCRPCAVPSSGAVLWVQALGCSCALGSSPQPPLPTVLPSQVGPAPVPVCAGLYRFVQVCTVCTVCTGLFRCVQVCTGLFRCVQVCSGLFRWEQLSQLLSSSCCHCPVLAPAPAPSPLLAAGAAPLSQL